jgi:ABC-2 type transport system permease protein
MRRELRIYRKLTKILLLSGLEYKGWWMMCIQVAFGLAADTLAIVLPFLRFGGVGEWSMEQILFVYVLAATSYGFAKIICIGLEYFPFKTLRTGDFDRLLLRPCSLFTQIIGTYFHIYRIPWALIGIPAIIWLLFRLNIPFSFFNIIILILALSGGFLTYVGVFIMTSGIAFFTIKGLDWIFIFTNASRNVTKCPVDYMPKVLWGTFTFLMPMLVISYYPAAFICGWNEPAFTGLLALPAGIVFLGISLFVWKIGVRHYSSTGS